MLCSVCHLLNGTSAAAHSGAEPSLDRKKRHPQVAHRTRDIIFDSYEEGESSDSLEISQDKLDADSRARSEERTAGKNRGSPRSRSADSTISRRLRATAIPDEDTKTTSKLAVENESVSKKTEARQTTMTQATHGGNPGTPSGGGPGADTNGIPKTTEYRSQYVSWALPHGEEGIAAAGAVMARKSASMGLIASQKKDEGDGSSTETWSVRPEETDDDDAALDAVKRGRIKKTEYKSKFRPFSAYTYVDGNWKKATRLIKDNEMPADGDTHAWYSEVVERLKKADQYRVRSHGVAPLYGLDDHQQQQQQQHLPLELYTHVRERMLLSPMSVTSSSRDSPDHSKSREGSTKKKSASEKTTARPKSAEPVIPAAKGENKSPKRTRPRAPRDLPVRGHGDLSGKKKSHKQGVSSPHGKSTEKGSPMGMKPRAVPRPGPGAVGVVNGDDGKVWLKPAAKTGDEKEETERGKPKKDEVIVNGYPEEDGKTMLDGELGDEDKDQDSAQQQKDSKLNGHEEPRPPIIKPPIRVPLTTVKSPEEMTGVRSPDPETWTVPLDIGKGLQWMDGKTPGGCPSSGETADL